MTECVLWTGRTCPDGYGRNGQKLAHRVAYEQAKGTIPPKMVIRHMCNQKLCVNADHLEVGTQQDNMNDMVRAGRQHKPKGVKNPRSKLTEQQVEEVRQLLLTGVSQQSIADRYGVSQVSISSIKLGKCWS